jgi:sensor histidine kinase regulating citrate/malate metabolism
MGIGTFAGESILDIALVLRMYPETTKQAFTLSVLGYCILLILFALIVTYEYLGVILRKNKELKQQRELAQIEEQQYQFMLSTAESLAEWKHDYQGQLRLIATLIEEENYSELKQFTTGVDEALNSSASLLFTGNRTLDAVISLRMMEAKRHDIHFETKLYLPESLPLHEVAMSSLIGNILDNAIEACLKLPSEALEIYFEMKPWKKMLCIFCSNTSDGKYHRGKNETLLSTKKTHGHGIGMHRIRDIVEAAGGTCQFSPEEHRFSVSIMIPLEESENENCSRRKRSSARRASPDSFAAVGQGASSDPRSR